jgi:hypothetical protein
VTHKSVGEVWVRTDRPPGASNYVVTLETDQDTSRVLTPDEALQHAAGILAAVTRAEYDAAVLRQLVDLQGLQAEAAMQMVKEMRTDRPPLDPAATDPMAFEPGVAMAGWRPFLIVELHGRPVGQWSMADARSHALAVLEAVTVADLDSGYYSTLIGAIRLEKSVARQVVDGLKKYRTS